MLGKWIDGLTDEQRDRIVMAQDWRPFAHLYSDGARCLVGHAKGCRIEDAAEWMDSFSFPGLRKANDAVAVNELGIENRFDNLTRRVGVGGAVRLVKVRACATIPIEQPKVTA